MKPGSFRYLLTAVVCAALLAGCNEMPGWMTSEKPIKRAPGERVDVVVNPDGLKADEALKNERVDVPEQTNLEAWLNQNEAMHTPHVGLTGVTREQSASVGEGNDFSRPLANGPVVAGGFVYAMDAAGVISAHDESDISHVTWRNDEAKHKHVSDALGGGLAVADGVIYAASGMGDVMAIDAASGKTKWHVAAGAPVRGAPSAGGGLVVVLTADNQTLAFDATTGGPRWNHRGMRESAGYFSITSPVISEDIVVAVYSSGEVFALRLETGNVLWSDTLGSAVRTKASDVFSGIDANPIVQDGVVVVASTSGPMQASALINGRPLWQRPIGTHSTPWSAGNVLYVLTQTHDIAALMKRDGAVRWANSLKQTDGTAVKKDITPLLYGPILSANAVLVIGSDGTLTSFKPDSGEKIGSYDLARDIITQPVVANGALYVMTKDATLYRYY